MENPYFPSPLLMTYFPGNFGRVLKLSCHISNRKQMQNLFFLIHLFIYLCLVQLGWVMQQWLSSCDVIPAITSTALVVFIQPCFFPDPFLPRIDSWQFSIYLGTINSWCILQSDPYLHYSIQSLNKPLVRRDSEKIKIAEMFFHRFC